MISSMTGFGRSIKDAPNGKIIVEIQSVNRKYLEVFVSLPKEYNRFENEVRKLVSEHVLRGQITVRIHVIPGSSAIQSVLPDFETLRTMKHGWENLAHSLGYEKSNISFPFLVDHAVVETRFHLVKEEDFEPISTALEEALHFLHEMKEKEGKALAKDILQRLDLLEKSLTQIISRTPEATSKLRQKLKDRMEEIFQPSAELDERLLREVALFAERVDISEEITRLGSHISQYRELLDKMGKGSGRKMDFLVQEMGREINTIGSKSMDAAIAHTVVEMKSELEKIREQIQNIE